jgi:hypothetical protein
MPPARRTTSHNATNEIAVHTVMPSFPVGLTCVSAAAAGGALAGLARRRLQTPDTYSALPLRTCSLGHARIRAGGELR